MREVTRNRQVCGGEVTIFGVGIGNAARQDEAFNRREPCEVSVDAARGQFWDRLHHEGGAEEGVQLEVLEGLIEIGQVQQDRTVEQGVLQTDFIAVDSFRREQQRGVRSNAGLHAVHIVAEGLVALGIRTIQHDTIIELVAGLDRAAQLAVVEGFRDTAVVIQRVRPRQTHIADNGLGSAHTCCRIALPQCRCQRGQIADGAATGQTIGADIGLQTTELFLVHGVTQTQRDIELVGLTPCVVGEQGHRLGRLGIEVLHRVTGAKARPGRCQRPRRGRWVGSHAAR